MCSDEGIPPDSVEEFEADLYPEGGKCESCGVNDAEEYYDNLIHGPSGWFCWECIRNSEMEL
jgi:hypothetical protein